MVTRTPARSAALAYGLALASLSNLVSLACPGPLAASPSGHVPSDLSQETVDEPPCADAATCPMGQAEDPPTRGNDPPGLAPLTPPQRAAFLAAAPDPPPESLGGVTPARHDRHYLTGNEHALHAFYPRIRGLGGGYLGVGAEQGYLLIGWSRSELAWLIDYDPAVVEIHRLHQTFLAAAPGPDAYLALWQPGGRRDAIAALRAAHPGPTGVALIELYRDHRARISKRLEALRRDLQAAATPNYLTDADDYAHVRELVLAGRVRPLCADLTRHGAVADIGASARRLGVHLRVLYLSNAEEYWERLPQPFRDNLRALPVDDRSLVLRTLLTWETNRDYRYNAQPARNYRAWLAVPDLRSIYDVIRRDQIVVDERGFFETRELPDPAALRRREQRRLAREAAGLPANG